MTSPFLTPPDTVSTARADNYHRVVVVYNWLGIDLEGLSRNLIELIVLWPLAAGFRLGPVIASRLYSAVSGKFLNSKQILY